MRISFVNCVCPFCEALVRVDWNKIEIEHDEFVVLFSFECPECGEYIEKEPIED